MTHPIPSGTRDVLPDEMRELRAITDRVRDVFERAGYGEIATPALEYAAVVEQGDPTTVSRDRGDDAPVYRLFDEQGNVLVLRSDMTIPIARVVADRFADAQPPLRLWYLAASWRGVRPRRGQSRELLQEGIELIGAPAPDGTAEAVTLLAAALDAAGLRTYRIGLGDATLYPALLERHGVGEEARARLMHELVTRDFVGLERALGAAGVDGAAAETLLRVPQLRGGPEVLDHADAAEAGEGLRAVHRLLAPEVANRVIFDLGLVRNLGYYTGAVFDVYDPALGMPLGGGGRYDDLLGRFGRPLPAVGFALNVEQLHIALTAGGGE